MEWIETTGKTVDEAVQRALRELGIDESELEYHVVQEPKSGFLGIGGSVARVRARVRPISREKPDRRNRRRRDQRGGGGRRRGGGERPARDEQRQGGRTDGRSRRSEERPERSSGNGGGKQRDRQKGGREERATAKASTKSEERVMSEAEMQEQATMAREFTEGLVERFGISAQVEARAEEDAVEITIDGDDVGVLIGPEGATMQALRELVRTALQRQTEGQSARVRIDVGGYDARRREALAEFARGVARTAVDTGRVQVLEPMSPPDRKVVHDAASEVDGVTTESEGDEPRRRVVIRPA